MAGGAYIWTKKRFKTGYIAVLIQILFDFTPFFKHQHVVK